ncbi:hypothetical protein CAPTEDRAFT_18433 [Capitella teleta]|uniref:Globin domain-containing protein n=1 Tax=Capitella teleta TaxID=283909 RepID=R7UZ91_CAPTE|nr:hypothetical protein CAPTEDRAFT_18433 [Capitella teleta]|eukprot:ELU11893.1 hypothetical protein CAPTEDRAFT_18433 [Capitella teleta]
MGLTPAQVASIQKNFATINSDLQGYGNKLFLRYLGANPGDMVFFPKFENVAYNDLVSNSAFNAQTLVVMEFLGKVVVNLGDLNKAGAMLQERVKTHKPRSISMAQFERLLDLLPRFLQEEGKASGAVADAWRVAVASLMPFMRAQFAK